jgi:hypothetical protein
VVASRAIRALGESALAVALAVALASSCADAMQRGPAPTPTAGKADVVIKDVAVPAPVAVRVGQTVGIVWPGGKAIWQVDFSDEELALLTPKTAVSAPGPDGWVFRAVKAATVEIVLTARTPCAPPPCDENPAKYTVTLRIR